MKYKLQINWSFPAESGWSTLMHIHDLDKACRALDNDSNLSRVCAPLRVIDDEGRVHRHYNPEFDWRLPGCFWRRTRRLAYELWEAAGSPVSDGQEFWYEAERQLREKADVGLRDGNFTQEDIEMYWEE